MFISADSLFIYISILRKCSQVLDEPQTKRTPLTPGKDGGPICSTDILEVIQAVSVVRVGADYFLNISFIFLGKVFGTIWSN